MRRDGAKERERNNFPNCGDVVRTKGSGLRPREVIALPFLRHSSAVCLCSPVLKSFLIRAYSYY